MNERGFTLVEAAVVLMIVGMMAGVVFAGQGLIRETQIHATMTQVERFKTAVESFHGKYGAIPGDLTGVAAINLGFLPRSGNPGQGDGNGLLDGEAGAGSLLQCGGETGMFWSDLTYADGMNVNLIEGSFGNADSPMTATATPSVSASGLATCFPAARIGRSNYFYVYEMDGHNYYGVVGMNGTSVASGVLSGVPSMNVMQAEMIDRKLDDGLPTTGGVQAEYLTNGTVARPSGASVYTSSTCYNNTTLAYAMDSVANGNGATGLCALSFRFQ
jgi:type II secretory pathway pseudopilin PulG